MREFHNGNRHVRLAPAIGTRAQNRGQMPCHPDPMAESTAAQHDHDPVALWVFPKIGLGFGSRPVLAGQNCRRLRLAESQVEAIAALPQ